MPDRDKGLPTIDARDIAQIAALELLRRERGLNPFPLMSPTPEKRSGCPFQVIFAAPIQTTGSFVLLTYLPKA